jgi:O-methyltransferase involved in polyketide biosynthesis
VQIIEQVKTKHPEAQTEFQAMEQFIDEFYGLTFLCRARIFDDTITQFLQEHPRATIVNIGCGLDTTFSRVDNGQVLWYDLDLPVAIEYRRQFLPESARNRYIAKSAFDTTWLQEIEGRPENGIFCFAGGLFHYFAESEVASIVDTMATQFPQGELFFDMPSRFGVRILKRRFQSYGIEGFDIRFGLGNARNQIPSWSQHVRVLDWFPMFRRIPKDTRWKWRTRMMMRLSDWFNVASFVHLKFV